MQPPFDALPAQRNPWDQVPGPKGDPALKPVLPSSAAARLRGLNYQAEGDQNLRLQLWQRAYANYRQAVNVADDLAEAHLRYGITLAMLNRFDQAAREFRRAVHVDPNLPSAEFQLETLFGPDSRLVRSSLISRVSAWADEDVADVDRLFVLAVLLHFDGDERAQELFSAIAELTQGDAQYAVVFLPRVDDKQHGDAIPPRPDDNATLPPAPLPPSPKPDANSPRTVPLPPKPMLNGPTNFAPKKSVDPPPASKPDVNGPVLLPPTPE
jgi:tetratricopeptide (TPR) repeat protein